MSQPIRLVQRDGGIINLDAQSFDVNMGRGIAAIPIPVLGERYGTDMNIVSVEISIRGIIRDDDCESITTTPTSSTAFIDFTRPNLRGVSTEPYFIADGGSVSVADFVNKPIYIRSTHQQSTGSTNRITIKFISTGTLGQATFPGSGVVNISLNHSNLTNNTGPSSGTYDTVAHEVATYLMNALNNTATDTGMTLTSSSHTSANSERLGHAFTATIGSGTLTALGSGRVDISQNETGLDGNSGTPSFWSTINDTSGSEATTAISVPSFQTFRGGTINTCKSAGDKVQDLIANVSNSNVMGAVGEIYSMDTNDSRGSIVSEDFNGLDPTAGASSDYIVGIQIPYQSTLQGSADGSNMVARNFLIVTGLTPASRQGAAANVNDAGVAFTPQDVYTGIRGTVTGFKFNYEAGDTFYGFTLTFKPIDFIVGL